MGESDQVQCVCGEFVQRMLLASHGATCRDVEVECLNDGCNFEDQRRFIGIHRRDCGYEKVACPSPGCDARLLRKDLDAHVELAHIYSAEEQIQVLWRENSRLTALSESEIKGHYRF